MAFSLSHIHKQKILDQHDKGKKHATNLRNFFSVYKKMTNCMANNCVWLTFVIENGCKNYSITVRIKMKRKKLGQRILAWAFFFGLIG